MDNLGSIKSRGDFNQKIIKSAQPDTSSGEEFSLILEGEVNKVSDAVLNREKELSLEQNNQAANNELLTGPSENSLKNILNLRTGEGAVNDILQNFSKPFIGKKITKKEQMFTGKNEEPEALYADTGWQAVFKEAANKVFADKEIDLTKLVAVNDKKALELNQLLSAEAAGKTPALVDIKNIYAEIVKETVTFKKDGVTRMRLRLEPEELGKMDIWLVLDNKKLSVAIVAANDVKELLEKEGGDLASLLGQAGYQLENFNFSSFGGQQQDLQNNSENRLELAEKREEKILNILNKEDIISNVNSLLTDIVVDYII